MYCQQTLHRICPTSYKLKATWTRWFWHKDACITCDLFLEGTVPFGTAQGWTSGSPLNRSWSQPPDILPRWEVRAPSRPVQGFQPLVAVSSLPSLARPQHKCMVIRMCHSRLSGLMDTTTSWSSVRDWTTSVQSSCPVVPRCIQAPFWGWCRPLHWAVVVALRQWDSFPSSSGAVQSLW